MIYGAHQAVRTFADQMRAEANLYFLTMCIGIIAFCLITGAIAS